MLRMLFGLGMAALLTMSAHAQQPAPSRLDDIIKRGTLRVGMTGDYRPFSYLDKTTSKFSGFDVDMAEALGKALGVKVEFVHTAWPQLMKDFESDNFDVAMSGVSITLDRQKKGLFSTPIMREGKTPIARCADKGKYETIADIDKPGTRVIVNPGGTNERFARANVKNAEVKLHNDNVTIFDEIAKGNADLMMTDSSETLYQQKLHPGVLCAVHPEKPFDFAEKAYWLQRDVALKAFVDQWLHIAREDGSFRKIYAAWFD
ncbi:transporter substrate-binding domain-containing protein [Bradyrhizobium sp. AUGA SZCCT0240]|jgi:cyclohexadienyl dehydratase|uniref:transporter substrate-binding domain-containing protein n=1 Tax=unclassified Bradyrhizobium TaxID=2631580 RepID=UPI001BABEFA0|nr:transporter substrate-binding domain-containing protein [Bradyrhizobium sp. AUGA SZCCT0160]MBR1196487.1 transporter substrate-binding domain-containing protein [Bradyrhizobium sp. AUGA SZCCT0158]MBR1241554.1 transporter substrate-binding domain-containing protein [Bradyrhizobium sp. AUGA SZCCT0274]MBR1249221.1 transporter substrate-binding domain-containing protein [Bradyrhizobium sp. AUGA SZCCT0169]MBR1254705.1 transporter substrate-binding domain-containing protein [Bradyrhizobium sp. AUGA